MKSLIPALQAHLDDGTTTLSWCWRITRADGLTFGFTDHDLTLSFDGTEFEPESGLTASGVRGPVGIRRVGRCAGCPRGTVVGPDHKELPRAVIREAHRRGYRREVLFEELDDPEDIAPAALIESPLYREGFSLQPWQQGFLAECLHHCCDPRCSSG